MIGALRETVTKTLDEFRQAGLVELCRGRIILRDVVGLQARMEKWQRWWRVSVRTPTTHLGRPCAGVVTHPAENFTPVPAHQREEG